MNNAQLVFGILLTFNVGSIVSNDKKETMTIYKYDAERFYVTPHMTPSAWVYRTFDERPMNRSVNYLAVPWWLFIRTNTLNKINLLDLKLDGGFTACHHVNYKSIIPMLRKVGIDVLFTPHAPPNPKKYPGITILPLPMEAINGAEPAQKKDILYSFIGMQNHLTRKVIFSLETTSDVVIKRRNHWHFYNKDAKKKEQEKIEYQNVMARSRFALCPRGVGASTIRFWEALQAGAIPVSIADDLVLPEVDRVDWNECVVFVAEKDIKNVDSIIRNITLEQEEEMRKNCLDAYELCSGYNFCSCIDWYYKNKGKE